MLSGPVQDNQMASYAGLSGSSIPRRTTLLETVTKKANGPEHSLDDALEEKEAEHVPGVPGGWSWDATPLRASDGAAFSGREPVNRKRRGVQSPLGVIDEYCQPFFGPAGVDALMTMHKPSLGTSRPRSWSSTDHRRYLNSMEEIFVDRLYRQEYCSMDVCGRAAPHPCCGSTATTSDFAYTWPAGPQMVPAVAAGGGTMDMKRLKQEDFVIPQRIETRKPMRPVASARARGEDEDDDCGLGIASTSQPKTRMAVAVDAAPGIDSAGVPTAAYSIGRVQNWANNNNYNAKSSFPFIYSMAPAGLQPTPPQPHPHPHQPHQPQQPQQPQPVQGGGDWSGAAPRETMMRPVAQAVAMHRKDIIDGWIYHKSRNLKEELEEEERRLEEQFMMQESAMWRGTDVEVDSGFRGQVYAEASSCGVLDHDAKADKEAELERAGTGAAAVAAQSDESSTVPDRMEEVQRQTGGPSRSKRWHSRRASRSSGSVTVRRIGDGDRSGKQDGEGEWKGREEAETFSGTQVSMEHAPRQQPDGSRGGHWTDEGRVGDE